MKTSESIKNLTKALVAAQSQMGHAAKGAKNPFYKSSYADLPTVMEVVKGPLNDNGLLVLQPSANRDGKNFIDTVIFHGDSGEFISSETEVICVKQNDPQSFGAAQTYARRFGLQAMLFIPAEDDDGNTAGAKSAPQYNKPAYQAPAPKATVAPPAVAPVALTPMQELANDPMPTSEPLNTVAPLQKSSFRKGVATKPAAEVTAAPTESEWG